MALLEVKDLKTSFRTDDAVLGPEGRLQVVDFEKRQGAEE